MRRLIFILLLLSTFPTFAQIPDVFTCEDDLSYHAQITIIPPILDETIAEIIVTALSVNEFDPVIGITATDGFTFCNVANFDAEIYDAQLASGNVPSSPLNAQEYVVDEGQNIVQIGEYDAKTGTVVLILESFIFDSDHHYTLQLTSEMLVTGSELNAYLFALEGDYNPSLTMIAADNTTVSGEPTEAQLSTVFDTTSRAIMASLPAIEGDVQLTVNAGGEGFYALVLELQTGESLPGDAAAQVTFDEDGAASLACDNQIISENAVRLSLPDDTYTVTALASDEIDPVLALIDEAGNGRCFDNTARADSYALELPSAQLGRSFVSSQVVAPPDSTVVIGANESLAGDYVLIIEGGTVQSGEIGDLFQVQVTPQMVSAFEFLTAYVFAADDGIDPILTWEISANEVLSCDNAGIHESCPEASPSLQGTSLTLANDEMLSGIALNAILQIPIDEGMEASMIPFRVSAAEDTGGEYIFVLHIITD